MPLVPLAERVAALQADLPEPVHAPEEVRRAAEEILARPEFRRPEPSLFDRFQDWLAEQLGRVFEAVAGGGRGSVVGIVLLVAALGAVAYFATRFATTVGVDLRARPVEPPTPVRTVGDWMAEAERAEKAGRWKDGVRYRYRALVAGLAERGVVDEIPGRTAGEYRSDVARSAPGAADDFAGATELFELVWYGDRPSGPAERDHLDALAARVLEGARR